MKAVRGRAAGVSTQRADTFTGTVWSDAVLRVPDLINVGRVFFEPASRTYWHRHPGGQVLCVEGGEGYFVTRSGDTWIMKPGDVIFAEPDEEHWHGALEETFVLHLAISLGETQWLEPVSDNDYTSMGSARQDNDDNQPAA